MTCTANKLFALRALLAKNVFAIRVHIKADTDKERFDILVFLTCIRFLYLFVNYYPERL